MSFREIFRRRRQQICASRAVALRKRRTATSGRANEIQRRSASIQSWKYVWLSSANLHRHRTPNAHTISRLLDLNLFLRFLSISFAFPCSECDSRALTWLPSTVVIFIEVAWLTLGVVWLGKFYLSGPIDEAKKIMLGKSGKTSKQAREMRGALLIDFRVFSRRRRAAGLVIFNWTIISTILVTIWCTFDAAGRSWVKMKKYQRSMRESESRFNYKRSGSMNRNWRQRYVLVSPPRSILTALAAPHPPSLRSRYSKVIRAYQDSWDHRCRLLFCCMSTSERNRNSFAEIARLLSDFFRELDVVPSDVVAGLVLLRKFQKLERQAVVRQVSERAQWISEFGESILTE